jgi:hypothetical protein
MKLPTQEQCLAYFDRYKVPKNIQAHCRIVQNTAVFLAQELNKEENNKINVELVRCLSIFHDLFKVVDIDYEGSNNNHLHNYQLTEEEYEMWKKLREKHNGMHETEVAFHVLKEDFPELAESIKGRPLNEKTQEQLLIHYCDWITLRDQIVSLKERLVYLLEAYPIKMKQQQYIREIEVMKQYEQKLFSRLTFQQEELKTKIEEQDV